MAAFTEEERAVDEGLGYPKAYAKLCRGGMLNLPYTHGPPFSFLPYLLQPQEALRMKELNEMFPVIDPEAIPSTNPRGFVNLLWKQLDHLGNAGFDPKLFRVDAYGNVLYLHADSASPLAWDIDHWFPCARGGKTVPSNLRILQSQVCRKKQNKLEFVIPWWDLQLGISVSQFLSIFASKNSDFRNRAFAFLFADGASEELSSLQVVEAHAFPQHFSEMKKKVGLAPAAIVSSRGGSDASVLKSLDTNRSLRPNYPLIAARKFTGEKDENLSLTVWSYGPNAPKENDNPDSDGYISNPYQSIAMARDSLRQREEAKKKQAEVSELENEITELKQKNEEERVAIQDLEALLIKRRRRVDKCRRLAEAQSNYKAVLEKMIRDAMHQSVVYKEQLRLNQAATSALMARLEAQRAMCDSSESELRRKYQQKDDIEKQIKPFWDQARKRSRVDDTMLEERYLSARRMRSSPQKQELRAFLEEDQKVLGEEVAEEEEEQLEETSTSGHAEKNEPLRMISFPRKSLSTEQKEAETERSGMSVREKLEQLAIKERHCSRTNDRKETMRSRGTSTHPRSRDAKVKAATLQGDPNESETDKFQAGKTVLLPRKSVSLPPSPPYKAGKPRNATDQAMSLRKNNVLPRSTYREDEEHMNQIGKGNVDKWLHMLMENSHEGPMIYYPSDDHNVADNISNDPDVCLDKQQLQSRNHGENSRNEITEECDDDIVEVGGHSTADGAARCRNSFDMKEREEKKIWFPRSDSARGCRSLPSSPSKILGMRRGVDCMGRKPKVVGDDDFGHGYEDSMSTSSSNFISKCKKAIKKAVNK